MTYQYTTSRIISQASRILILQDVFIVYRVL